MKSPARVLIAAALTLSLAACGGDDVARDNAPLPKLDTHVVAAGDAQAGRSRDGVVEAVREAALSAQTSGRVTAVEVDVNDRVVAGQILLRLSVVEQQAGVDAARAQLRAAEASAVEAERNYQRFASLSKDNYVSRAQLDQARAPRAMPPTPRAMPRARNCRPRGRAPITRSCARPMRASSPRVASSREKRSRRGSRC